jgi:hypothetical protein
MNKTNCLRLREKQTRNSVQIILRLPDLPKPRVTREKLKVFNITTGKALRTLQQSKEKQVNMVHNFAFSVIFITESHM